VTLRAKVGVHIAALRGDAVGLAFDGPQLSLFDEASGRALKTARHDRGAVAVTRGSGGAIRDVVMKGAAHG
jgi:hypothetical protein